MKNRPGPKSSQFDATKYKALLEMHNIKTCVVIMDKLNDENVERDGGNSSVKNTSSTSEYSIKNTDKSMTIKTSAKCVFCNKKQTHLSSHYNSIHSNCEPYNSRMSIKLSNELRNYPSKALNFLRRGENSATCHFCEKDLTCRRYDFYEHILRHTGEYTKQCCQCNINMKPDTEKTRECSHKKVKIVPQLTMKQNGSINIFMCELCNFAQCQEKNLQEHVMNMHNAKSNISARYKKIVLAPSLKPETAIKSTARKSGCRIIDPDVFTSSKQNDDILNPETMRLMKENSFDTSSQGGFSRKTTPSMAEKLSERFQKEKETADAKVKEEDADEGELNYRATEHRASDKKKYDGPSISLSEAMDGVKECKVEIVKMENEANTSNVSIPNKDLPESDDDVTVLDDNSQGDDGDWETESDNDENVSPSKSNLDSTINRLCAIAGKSKSTKNRFKKKRNEKSVLPMIACKKEKPNSNIVIDLDDDSDSGEKVVVTKPVESTTVRAESSNENRISNISYSNYCGLLKLKCLIGSCDHVAVNNSMSFLRHLQSKHSEHWDGVCQTCDKQILHGSFSLAKEYYHMEDVHLSSNTNPSNSSPSKNTDPDDNNKRKSDSPKPATEVQKPEKPRPMIKLRRLSGDLLSGNKDAPTNTAIVQDPASNLLISNVVSLTESTTTMEQQIPTYRKQLNELHNKNSPSYASENPLKPWTKCRNAKSESAVLRLLREISLIALYKCMAIDCIFTTSDKRKMHKHLINHEEMPATATQTTNSGYYINGDQSSWLECSYCEEVSDSCGALVKHIETEHITSIYQCSSCFYRSVDMQNVRSHIKDYHSNSSDQNIFVCGLKMEKLSDEIEYMLTEQTKIPKIFCAEPGNKFIN